MCNHRCDWDVTPAAGVN